MKKIFTLVFIVFTQIVTGQNITAPTGTSTEVGETAGQLSVSLTGAATYSIPIQVPPGLNGVVPQLSLNYSSQSGNGIAGYGWNIGGLSAITRIPSTKFHDGTDDPVDFDALDRFALDGQRLIVKTGTTGIYGANNTVYETENFSNVKVTSFGVHPSGASYGPAWFKVEYPDGSVAEYGNGTGVVARSLMTWAIKKWENPQAVSILYDYTLTSNILEIEKIHYGSISATTHMNHIEFNYKSRQRSEQYYIAGQNFENLKILSVINIVGFRKYLLTQEITPIKYEKLVGITEKNEDETLSLNPIVFEYDNDVFDSTSIDSKQSYTLNTSITATHKSLTGDFDGDGNSDFIFYKPDTTDNLFLFKGLIGGVTNAAIQLISGGTIIDSFTTKLKDNNNIVIAKDCWSNIVVDSSNNLRVKYYKKNDLNNTIDIINDKFICTKNSNDKIKNLTGDFNGDGLTDIIIFRKKYHPREPGYSAYYESFIYFNDLISNTVTKTFYTADLDDISGVHHDYKTIDFNGDGKSDFLFFDNTGAKVFTLNSTFDGVNFLCSSNNTILNTIQPLVGDFNGDGKTDFVVPTINQDNWTFYISNGVTFESYTKSIGIIYNNQIENKVTSSLCDGCHLVQLDPLCRFNSSETFYQLIKNYIVNDFDGDGKSDILIEKKAVFDHRIDYYGYIACVSYPTSSVTSTSGDVPDIYKNNLFLNIGTNFGQCSFGLKNDLITTGNSQNNILPLTMLTNISKNRYNLNYSFVKGKVIYCQATYKSHKKSILLKKIITGNGVNENITYKELKSESIITTATISDYNIFTPATRIESYPNFDLNNAYGLMVVSKLEKTSKNTNKKQLFSYLGAVSNTEGLGFLGFRSSMRTDWFDDETKIFSNVTNYDISRRGTAIANFKVAGFVLPSLDYNPTEYVSKSIITYNSATNALQPNKVFKLKNTKTETWNTLDNTSSESTSILDEYNNPTSVITNIKNIGVIEKTTFSTIAYDNQPSATIYYIGRPTSKTLNIKIYSGQADEDVSETNEVYTYQNHLLTKIQKKAKNSNIQTDFLTEDNIFDAFGNITKKTITAIGETPRVTNFEYSATYGSRFLTKSIDVELLETNYTYDPVTGSVLTELMPSNTGFPLLTTNTYDTWGKKIKVKNYLNKEVNYAYTRDSEKTLITATSDDGSSTTELYDDLGSKIKTGSKTIDGTWAFTETEYDNFDRAVKTSEPFFDGATKLWNETTFDSYGRPLEIKAATGKIAKYTYPDFLTVNVNDGTLNKTNVKNALGNVISLTDTQGGTITYKYFANGNLKQSTFGSAVTTITQDGWGRKIKLVEPSAGEYNYTYNGFGQALTETTPNGTTAYTYTNIGKLDTKWVKGKPSTDGTFSGTNILSTYSYYPNKMLEKITVTNPNDGNSVYNYTYDDYKRITYTKEEFTTIAPRKFENRIEYDEFGRTQTETSIATINGFSQTKTYFNEYKNGELFKKRENNATGNPIWTLNTRNARGQITSATLGDNHIAHINTYHDLGHTLTTSYNKVATPTVSMMTLTNTYDYVQGNMLTRSNSLFSWNETFSYDSNDRLTSFTNKNGNQTTQEYEVNGKIKSNFLGQYRYSNAKPYQNTSIKLSTAGQQEAGLMVQQTLVYSAFKAPISIVQGTQKAFFGYNFAQNRSVMYFGNSNANKLLQPKRRFYSADGTMEITQTLATNVKQEEIEFTTFIGGDAYSAPALARQTNNASSSVFYLHRDHLGTILAVSNNLAVVVEKRLFDAWGDIIKIQDDKGNILAKLTFIDRGYTGHEHLQNFRLINMNGRLYDPRLHRFLQPDNNLQEPYNTQNYNRYGYVLNNPLKYTDPSGEDFWSDFIAGAAIVVGVVLTIASVGTLAAVGASLIAAGVAHFGTAAANYFNSGSGTQGNWDASSSNAGFSFSTSVSTDFGYGPKKDVANNNNPVENHPQVSCGYASIAAASFLNNPITTDYNNIYDYYNNGQVFSNQGELEGYINKYIGNQDKIEKTMKTCFILATNNNVPPGYSLFDNDIIKPDGGRAGGVTVPMLKNSSNIFIAPSLKGDYFGIVRATSQGIVHETLHAFHLSKGLANFNNYSEGATSMYTYTYLKAYGSINGAKFYYSQIVSYPQSFSWRNLPEFINTGLK